MAPSAFILEKISEKEYSYTFSPYRRVKTGVLNLLIYNNQLTDSHWQFIQETQSTQ